MPVIKHELAPDLTIYEGHVIDGLRLIPDKTVQCIATSDPYWGLRDYGADAWEGGDPDCDHGANTWDGPKQTGAARSGHAAKSDRLDRATCVKCGARRVNNMATDWPEVTYRPMPGLAEITVPAWQGAYGLEPTPEMYVAHSVLIRRELWRVLRDDGVHWLNLGDTYANDGKWGGSTGGKHVKALHGKTGIGSAKRRTGLKPKELVGIPGRVAFALQADGWYLRSAPPWIKDNPMPESVLDRPGTAHESIFLLTKSERYFYDIDAVRKASVGQSTHDLTGGKYAPPGQTEHTPRKRKMAQEMYPADMVPDPTKGRPSGVAGIPAAGRNRRTNDWWYESLDITIASRTAHLQHLKHVKEHGGLLTDEDGGPLGFMVNTKPFNEAHFAVWPEALVEPMILAGTSPKACPKCLAPWRRVTGEPVPIDRKGSGNKERKIATGGERSRTNTHMGSSIPWQPTATPTVDWKPTCACEDNDGSGKCIVLDPFGGSMTTVRVALEHGRAGVACELNPEYIRMGIRARLDKTQTSLLGQM